ncbi:MAG: META domain-containing protein [Ignavibacteriota bacterium]
MLKLLFVFICSILILNACNPASLSEQIIGKEWQVTSLIGKTLNPNDMKNGLPFLNFSENGKLFGSTGCNSFTGVFKLDGAKLSLNPEGMTKMMCPGNTEQDFLDAINQVTNVKMDGNKLNLLNRSNTVMSLKPKTK